MSELDVIKADVKYNIDGEYELILTIPKRQKASVQEIYDLSKQDKPLIAEVKPKRKKRSLDANSYMWVLCQKIAEKIKSTKNEVYIKAIKEAGGMIDYLMLIDGSIETFIQAWNKNGLGWYAEVSHKAKLDGCTVVRAYYGSSVFDQKTMSTLLDYIVDEAKNLDIQTETPEEIERLKSLWKGVDDGKEKD